jgi:hypothetical protein
MANTEFAFRKAAQEIRELRRRVDLANYHAPRIFEDQSNRIATVWGHLTKASMELEAVAKEIENDKWGGRKW